MNGQSGFCDDRSRPLAPKNRKSLMLAYIARRILLMIPTLFGIMLISFAIVQFAPGGPVERIIAQLQGQDSGATSRISGGGRRFLGRAELRLVAERPTNPRPAIAARRASTRNSSSSSRRSSASTSLPTSVSSRCSGIMPVSISARAISATSRCCSSSARSFRFPCRSDLWMTLLSYAISIPLGIRKAVKDGSSFDVWTSGSRHRRLRDPGLPVCHPADRSLCRRVVLADLSACAD